MGISQDEAGQAIADFANAQGVGLEIIGVTEESGLYKIAVSVEGQESEVYITKDGKSLVNGLIPLVSSPNQEPAQNQQQPAEIVKSDKPVVELFVMSFCPYGTQSEKGILPVFELLGDKIDSNIRFVYYAMHGDTEIYEQLNQYCIQEEQADKYYNYLTCFLEDSDGEKCLNEVGIDLNKLKECTEKADEEFSVTENFNNKDVWLSGRYPLFDIHADLNEQYSIGGSPTLIVNGVQLNAGRDPASYLAGICTTFNNAPEECGDTLSGEAPAPGFGWGETGPNTEAQC